MNKMKQLNPSQICPFNDIVTQSSTNTEIERSIEEAKIKFLNELDELDRSLEQLSSILKELKQLIFVNNGELQLNQVEAKHTAVRRINNSIRVQLENLFPLNSLGVHYEDFNHISNSNKIIEMNEKFYSVSNSIEFVFNWLKNNFEEIRGFHLGRSAEAA